MIIIKSHKQNHNHKIKTKQKFKQTNYTYHQGYLEDITDITTQTQKVTKRDNVVEHVNVWNKIQYMWNILKV